MEIDPVHYRMNVAPSRTIATLKAKSRNNAYYMYGTHVRNNPVFVSKSPRTSGASPLLRQKFMQLYWESAPSS